MMAFFVFPYADGQASAATEKIPQRMEGLAV